MTIPKTIIKFKATVINLLVIGLVLSLQIFGSVALASTITEGYRASTDMVSGTVVSLTKSNANTVEKTTTNNDILLAGVVVGSQDSLLNVQPAGSQVRVAINGEVSLQVSTVNGNIKSGDRLIASPLEGIAADDYPPAPGAKYIAIAEENFTTTSSSAQKTSVSLNNGSIKDVYIGVIKAKMLLGDRTSDTSQSKNLLITLGKQLSGKNVTLAQVLAAAAVFITTIILSGLVLYGSVRGTFVSLGRNPLSKDSILTGLMRVIVIAILVLAVGVTVSYTILIL